MNIVMITTGSRLDLLEQAITSLCSVPMSRHTLTLVVDNPEIGFDAAPGAGNVDATLIVNGRTHGASASRNIGASSIPKYRRQSHVMFLDDDVYMLPKWDERLEEAFLLFKDLVLSGHSHPFNHPVMKYGYPGGVEFHSARVLSTVHMAMPWDIWDDVGFFSEPGGPGGSEDVDWCARAAEKGYGFAVLDPHCVVHCGLTSSSGKQIVGYGLMVEQNHKLVESYGLTGKVKFE